MYLVFPLPFIPRMKISSKKLYVSLETSQTLETQVQRLLKRT